MNADRLIRFDGIVSEVLADGKYRVRFSNGHEIVAHTDENDCAAGEALNTGTSITVEISPYDLNSGRLIFRHAAEAPCA
ncbi:MAG: translation initiation factor IF-1 [Rhodospirillaceae bacterium]